MMAPTHATHPWRRFEKLRACVALVLVVALFNACTTTHAVSGSQLAALNTVVKVGDTVDVTLRNGTHEKFQVARVDALSVSDHNHSVPASDITALSVEHFSAGKTTLLVVGGIIVALGIAVAATGAGHYNLGGLTKGP